MIRREAGILPVAGICLACRDADTPVPGLRVEIPHSRRVTGRARIQILPAKEVSPRFLYQKELRAAIHLDEVQVQGVPDSVPNRRLLSSLPLVLRYGIGTNNLQKRIDWSFPCRRLLLEFLFFATMNISGPIGGVDRCSAALLPQQDRERWHVMFAIR